MKVFYTPVWRVLFKVEFGKLLKEPHEQIYSKLSRLWVKEKFLFPTKSVMKQEVSEWRKGQRSFCFHPNSAATVTALPGCATSVWGGRVSAWQAVSGLVSLQEEESESQGQNLQVHSLPPHQGDLHFHTHHSLLTGGKSGSRWGVGLPPP